MARTDGTPRERPRRGDVVRVRSRDEILATLDASGSIDSLPFMPEMLEFAGRDMRVWARSDKTCDTINITGNRNMENTVHLVGARCTGSAHGGCQASCMLFFREEWLEWPDRPGTPVGSPPPAGARQGLAPGPAGGTATEDTIVEATNGTAEGTYRCQATEHFRASTPMKRHNYSQYLEDVRSRNVTLGVVIRGLLLFVFNRYQGLSKRYLPRWLRIRGGNSVPFVIPTGDGAKVPPLDLQPGDLVEVKSKEEILATLGPDLRNNNLLYDAEMLPYSGRRARVAAKVTRIIDEHSGRMLKLGDCYTLEEVVCLGLYHRFCQRAITPYWRSAWLRKVDVAEQTAAASTQAGSPVGRV